MKILMGRIVGRKIGEDGRRHDYDARISAMQRLEINDDSQVSNCLTTVQKDNVVVIQK